MSIKSFTRDTKFRVLRDVTFPDADGNLVHAKKGDVVSGYPPSSARIDVRDGVIEVHEKGKEADK